MVSYLMERASYQLATCYMSRVEDGRPDGGVVEEAYCCTVCLSEVHGVVLSFVVEVVFDEWE